MALKMSKNMGSTDKILRYLAAAVLVVLYFTETLTGTLGYIALGVAGIFVLTSLFSFCPLYCPLGVSTCKKSE